MNTINLILNTSKTFSLTKALLSSYYCGLCFELAIPYQLESYSFWFLLNGMKTKDIYE